LEGVGPVEQTGAHRVPALLRTSPRHGADCFQHRLGQGLTVSLTPVKYISPLVSNNYRWGVEIPTLHTVSNKPTPPPK